jgi:hypothetical protein
MSLLRSRGRDSPRPGDRHVPLFPWGSWRLNQQDEHVDPGPEDDGRFQGVEEWFWLIESEEQNRQGDEGPDNDADPVPDPAAPRWKRGPHEIRPSAEDTSLDSTRLASRVLDGMPPEYRCEGSIIGPGGPWTTNRTRAGGNHVTSHSEWCLSVERWRTLAQPARVSGTVQIDVAELDSIEDDLPRCRN